MVTQSKNLSKLLKLTHFKSSQSSKSFFSQATVEWFKIYKMPDGKPANEFAFNSEPKNKEFAENIIAGCHESWKKLSRYSKIQK